MFKLSTSKTMVTPVLIDDDTTNTRPPAQATCDDSNVVTTCNDTMEDAVLVDGSSERDEEKDNSTAPEAPGQEHVIVVDGSLTYDNVPAEAEPTNDDPLLSDSLHTTSSQASMDIASFVPTTTQDDDDAPSPKQEDAFLSFHASQVDSWELKDMELATSTAEHVPSVVEPATTALESSSTQEREGHNLDVLVTVGSQLLRQEDKDEAKDDERMEPPKKSSKGAGSILKILALILVLVAIRGMTMPSTSDSRMKEEMDPIMNADPIMNTESAGTQQEGEELLVSIPSFNNVKIEETKEPTIVVDEYVAQDDDDSAASTQQEGEELLVSIPSFNNSMNEETKEPTIVVDEYVAHDDDDSAASTQQEEEELLVSIPSFNNSMIEETKEATIVVEKYVAQGDDDSADLESSVLLSWKQIMQAACNLFLMVFVAFLSTSSRSPQQTTTDESGETPPEEESLFEEGETEEPPLESEDSVLKKEHLLDLRKYETLKVVELRELLRSRKCKTVGKKPVLIQRLAAVYQAELETLTVRQLRPILKSKGCKTDGRKSEFIQRLVEAGIM